eukprot:TRINITY_DN1722_c0_g3_i2.p1 TRINITY_DN1722_c0_g3~~TRINITY_DN1722_c0_g3_i2.p1  ORF type:complete len:930 (+),score=263.50 TRINITY_DN1722_c0_g3_i2:128-2917(+)
MDASPTGSGRAPSSAGGRSPVPASPGAVSPGPVFGASPAGSQIPATPGAASPGPVFGASPAGSQIPATPGAASPGPVFGASPAGSPAHRVLGSPPSGGRSPSPLFARTPGSAASSPAATPAGRRGSGVFAAGSPASPPVAGLPAGSPVRTPARVAHRGFFRTAPGSPPSGGARHGYGMPLDEETHFIYGTSISDQTVTSDFHRFVSTFKANPADEPYYLSLLHKSWEDNRARAFGVKFPISGLHLQAFSEELYQSLINFPTEVIPIFDRELWHIAVRVLQVDPDELHACQVKVFDLNERDSRIMRLMNPSTDCERLVSLKGIVIRCSDLVPDMQAGTFQCGECKHEVKVQLSHWTIDEPTHCESCNKKGTFQIQHNESTFGNRQMLKLQETPEIVPEGETPQSVVVYCYDDLVNQVRPGDRVEVTGIYRASAVRPNLNRSLCNSVYRTHIDAIAIATEKTGRMDAVIEDIALDKKNPLPTLADKPDQNPELVSDEDIAWNLKVRALAAEVDADGKRTVVEKLVQSLAPSIYEEKDPKKGLLCQLFGGTAKATSSSTKGRCRPEINTLLCGDPSTAKSQLLQYAYKLAPRAVYTSGKGSSAVGLTASINKDPITKDLVLESGALVLADRGMCCIDEFDKMDENARAILHEAMEQQTVSVAKAGIVCSLNARTSILASANPKDSSYDPKKSVVDNINLPKNLMTRFDMIWLMLDKRNREMDYQLAEHLISMYSEGGARKREDPSIEPELFRRYISFARRYVFPRITDACAAKLRASYIELRNQGSSREVITATPRILESLIRISESLAKMELREEVTAADVDEAVRLLKAATYAAAIDPETGLIDMEQLIAGVGAGRRKRQKELESMLEEVLREKGLDLEISVDGLTAEINERLGAKKEQLLTTVEFNQAIQRLEGEGRLRRRGGSVIFRG